MPKTYFVPLMDNGCGSMPAGVLPAFMTAFRGVAMELMCFGSSHPDRGMNQLANAFMRSQCEELVLIDLDISFTAQDVALLLSHETRPLVYGMYPLKNEAAKPCLVAFPNGDAFRKTEHPYLIEVRRAGRGFMKVQRCVFEAMKEENGGGALRYHNHGEMEHAYFRSGVFEGEDSCLPGQFDARGRPLREWKSEDWVWSDDCRRMGFPTLVDIRIALGHLGMKEYRLKAETEVKRGQKSGSPGDTASTSPQTAASEVG